MNGHDERVVNIRVAVISSKEAWQYVGNQMIWKELLEAYPDLVPIRTAKRGDQFWLVSEIDNFLIRAQLEGILVRGNACSASRC